ncbi:MAG: 16S rRNA (guanine(527)-N(7))-methyltransferase RsmG, partial [Dehalococcoidia bacterium]|nr:16S rRNA (guanine(527)-N(7))-methyltransferase RsmG [Dehalococcoidia bacterium]
LRMIDVGSGAGFPGIPLSLLLSDVHVTLLEATGKKAEFLSHIVDTLDLRDVQVIKGRAEDLGRSACHREQYDVAVARAVAALSTLAEYCLPFISPGGSFIALKKGDIREEIEHSATAFRVLGGGEVRLLSVPLPQLPDSRYLVCSTKKSHTPPHYPRRAGMPTKHPL